MSTSFASISACLLALALAGCPVDKAPVATDTSTDTGTCSPCDTGTDTNTDTDTHADTDTDTSTDTHTDTSTDTHTDTGTDTGTDTATDTATCEGTTCVVYACYCGECTDADIQCVAQAWADANPCALGCPVAECPALATTECECDDASGDCRKK